MVTLEQIQEAQSKVKTGKDFPQLVSDLKVLGIRIFETHVATGETIYYDFENNQVITPPLFEPLKISAVCHIAKFREILRFHQEGNSNFITFCHEVAEAGINKWLVDVNKRNCIYFDRNGTLIHEEEIPE
jgi:2,3-bisphosphoglycerate-independent phosphoglycerate mutase